MTMTEIRKELNNRAWVAAHTPGIESLAEFHKDVLNTLEKLWKDGYVNDYSDDFRKYAYGYQINSQNYDTFHIVDTLDLHTITATKAAVKELGTYIAA